MYFLNCRLIASLPSLMGTTVKDVIEELGVHRATFTKWSKGEISCSSLVQLCNTYRISVSSFIVLKENQELLGRFSDYTIPSDKWSKVEWHNEKLGTLFGPGGLTGKTKTEGAKKLGFASYQIFDHWSKAESSIRVKDFLNLLNTFQIDASLFFTDSNNPIPLPAWEVGNKHVVDIIADRLEGYRELERKLLEKEQEIRALRTSNERLKKENIQLREIQKGSPVVSSDYSLVAEPYARYGASVFRKGYEFHAHLWEKLPDLLGMTHKDFHQAVGLNNTGVYANKNILVDVLITACNLFHISITHFFIPKGEVAVVYDKDYYVISSRNFTPVESRMERMKYLFGRYSVIGVSREDLKKQKVGPARFTSMADRNGVGRVLTLCDICSTFNISPMVFFKDENRRKANYAESRNELLLINAIQMAKEIRILTQENWKLKKSKE